MASRETGRSRPSSNSSATRDWNSPARRRPRSWIACARPDAEQEKGAADDRCPSSDRLRPSRSLPELEVQAGVEDEDVTFVVGARDGTGLAKVAQFFVHIHQVGLHDEPWSQSVGHTAAISLIVAGIVLLCH